MARPKSLKPKHCHHKATNRGFVILNGEWQYTGSPGSWGTQDAIDQYDRLIGEWIGRGRVRDVVDALAASQTNPSTADSTASTAVLPTGNALTVNIVLAAFWLHAKKTYRVEVPADYDGTDVEEERRDDGTVTKYKPTGERHNYRNALRPLRRLYGITSVLDFGPKRLKALRLHLIQSGQCRSYINRNVRRIIAIFNWAASEELIPASIPEALGTVAGLRRGQDNVREAPPVRPVPEMAVDAVLQHLPAPVRAMAELQAITGARQGELIPLRPCDINRSNSEVWEYRPTQHKSLHHGHERVIFFGKRSQLILEPYLKGDPQAPCFSPAAAEALRNSRRRAERETPMTPSHARRSGTSRRGKASRAAGSTYDSHSYRRAITRACEKAFGFPPELRKAAKKPKDLTPAALAAWAEAERQRKQAAKAWRKTHVWTPHRLRHNAATRFRRDHGMEATQVLLGHRLGSRVTEIYADEDTEKARKIMGEVG